MTGTLTKVSGINANNKEVELPSEMNGRKVVKIGNEVFRDNEFITKVILPDTITTIAIRASDGCSNLTEVVLPNGFVSIGEWTFANCTALRSVDLGNLMEISDLVPRRLAFAAVYGNSVPNLILDNEHTEFS